MKRIVNVIIILITLCFATTFVVNASGVGESHNLKEIYEDQKLIGSVENLDIEQNDVEYINKVDFSEMTNLNRLTVFAYINPQIKIKLNRQIEELNIHYSIIDLNTFDLEEYKDIIIVDSFNMGKKIINICL